MIIKPLLPVIAPATRSDMPAEQEAVTETRFAAEVSRAMTALCLAAADRVNPRAELRQDRPAPWRQSCQDLTNRGAEAGQYCRKR